MENKTVNDAIFECSKGDAFCYKLARKAMAPEHHPEYIDAAPARNEDYAAIDAITLVHMNEKLQKKQDISCYDFEYTIQIAAEGKNIPKESVLYEFIRRAALNYKHELDRLPDYTVKLKVAGTDVPVIHFKYDGPFTRKHVQRRFKELMILNPSVYSAVNHLLCELNDGGTTVMTW